MMAYVELPENERFMTIFEIRAALAAQLQPEIEIVSFHASSGERATRLPNQHRVPAGAILYVRRVAIAPLA